ncbi:MAG: ACT domain-containing protein [Candidatus Shapirobacteria bacterium]|jgi:hypothetical protein
MRFILLPGGYSVFRFGPGQVPALDLRSQAFCCVTSTKEEVSVICASGTLEGALKVEDGWRALKIAGPLDFSLVGVLAEASGILAEAKVSIFAVSTFDTDYLLVKAGKLDDAIAALEAGGHCVEIALNPAEIYGFRDGEFRV